MKGREPRPMRTIGNLSLCRSLLAASLVDRFRVVVFPVITGATGTDRIFDGHPDIALDLVDSRCSTVAFRCSNTYPECSSGRLARASSRTQRRNSSQMRPDRRSAGRRVPQQPDQT